MKRLSTEQPLTAIVYDNGWDIDPIMARVASLLRMKGCALAGFVQRNVSRPGRRRCDMILEDLASGDEIAISEDRGPLARGCHLNLSALLRGLELSRKGLELGADLLIINKYGKSEGEGGGFRPLIAEALLCDVPVLVAVPSRNLDNWRLFVGDLSREVQAASMPIDQEMFFLALGFSFKNTDLESVNADGSRLNDYTARSASAIAR